MQHLCSGHNEIYAQLDNNQAGFENGLEHLLQGFSLHTDSLGGVCVSNYTTRAAVTAVNPPEPR
ncbi:MAG: hypothetical protein WA667_06375 [Candidatus Nitrosopolaris sp.]